MKRAVNIVATLLVLGFILAPVTEAGITMVWSRFLAVKADRVLVTTDDAVGAPSGQTAGTVVIEAGGNTPALSISGYAGQTEPLVYLEDGAGTEVFSIGPAGELTTTGAMSLGDATFNGDLVITGTLDAQGAISNSTGDVQIDGDLDITRYLYSSAGDLAIADSATITGAVSLQSSLAVTAGMTVGRGLQASGDSYFFGPVTLTDTLSVDGAATLNRGVTVNGSAVITGALDVQNYIYNSLGALYVFGDQDLYGYLFSSNGPVGISDNVVITGTVDIAGSVADSGGTFVIADSAQITGTLDVMGSLSDSGGTFTIDDDASVTGALGVTGASTLGGAVTINDNATITGTLDVQGALSDSATDLAINDNVAVTGFLYHSIDVTAVTTDTAPAAGVSGTWFTASGANTTITLPAAAEGLYFCVYNHAGDDTYIDVQTGDQVHTLTNATGDRVTNTTAGDSICLLAVDTQYWIATQTKGTWADAD